MKGINKILFFALLFCSISVNLHANWEIIGDAVGKDARAFLELNEENNQEFVFVGQLSDHQFKITDGTDIYIHDCGDSDPLGDSIPLRIQDNTDETGFRIRYVGEKDYFKVTLIDSDNVKSLKVEKVDPPKNIYIMGGPFNNSYGGWDLQDAVELEVDKENPFIFYYKGDLRYNEIGDEGGNIKILKGRGWGENYHPEGMVNVPLSQANKMRLGGTDTKWTIPANRSADGYYELKVDMLNLTLTVEKFEPNIVENPYPRIMFVVGDALPCGWPADNKTPMEMLQTEEGIYEWEGIVSAGEFKFPQKRGTYARCYVSTVKDQPVFSGQEYPVIFEESYFGGAGNDYKFVITQPGAGKLLLNLKTNTLTVEGQPTSSGVETTHNDNGIDFYSNEGKLFIKSENNQQLQAIVFSIDGVAVAQKTFTGNTNIALSNGYYLVLIYNEAGERIANIRTIVN